VEHHPTRTRIKICGIRNPDVARHACDAGADAIGLMFYAPSPRHLELDQAAHVRRGITPFSTAVAVMVNPDRSYVQAIIGEVGVDRLQFHGEESDEFCAGFGLPYIKVLRVNERDDLAPAIRDYPRAAGILLDTEVPGLYGGAGKTFDWSRAKLDSDVPVILAGGLSVDNVAAAMDIARPYGVDVSSGVETDGEKDPAKITAFCNAVLLGRH